MTDTIQSSSLTDSSEAVQEEIFSIIDLMTSGGTGGNIIMSVLVILSIFSIYILIERISSLNKAKKGNPDFISKINTLVNNNKFSEAISICKEEDSTISRMIEKGLKRNGKPLNEKHSAKENQGKLEVNKIENNLQFWHYFWVSNDWFSWNCYWNDISLP